MKIKTIKLVKVNETEKIIFNSYIEKERFIKDHLIGTYTLVTHDCAELHKYICIDKDNNGFVLNYSGLTYYECVKLINMYY